ncbi:GNAT family N-acetyltransferase [Aeromicrobium wangtongii]|uniref:GNAT family N-acetyltransferase n=1 Tax=Aeromicrobium wangtongii TaxID=2969247 RepID=UPI002016AD5C|nr:GNAT family N-acetyltransferase [Aeromicrobium wangtongii]MCL3818304.1 GNAT family N-acetyltransferase [Aeromicrobium wangtongii]
MSEHPLVLRRLELRDQDDVTAAVAEMAAEGEHWSYRYRGDLPWPDYVRLVRGWEDGIDLPEDFVAHAELVAEVDGEVVGRSSIRWELNDFLGRLGGHIGYAVRPAHRRQGHATEILRQSVQILRDRGVRRILVTCDDDNLASARVIEANGGVLEAVVPHDDPDEPPRRRYWISA